jgi:hypothetical protein
MIHRRISLLLLDVNMSSNGPGILFHRVRYRTAGGPQALRGSIRQGLGSIDPELPRLIRG